jgi:signal transduction protein with GAF and PtsI domain
MDMQARTESDADVAHSPAQSPEQRMKELETEFAYLREAASAFGALAERLNQQLIESRRLRYRQAAGSWTSR